MKKVLLVLLCLTLAFGTLVNDYTLNERKTLIAEDIPYEWSIINNNQA